MSQKAANFYGYCPICGALGVYRERRLNGNDVCGRGHTYASSQALPRPQLTLGQIIDMVCNHTGIPRHVVADVNTRKRPIVAARCAIAALARSLIKPAPSHEAISRAIGWRSHNSSHLACHQLLQQELSGVGKATTETAIRIIRELREEGLV